MTGPVAPQAPLAYLEPPLDAVASMLRRLLNARSRLMLMYDIEGALAAGQEGLLVTQVRELLREALDDYIDRIHLPRHAALLRQLREPHRTIQRLRCIQEIHGTESPGFQTAKRLEFALPAPGHDIRQYIDEVWQFLESTLGILRPSSLDAALRDVQRGWAEIRTLIARPELIEVGQALGLSLDKDIFGMSVIEGTRITSIWSTSPPIHDSVRDDG